MPDAKEVLEYLNANQMVKRGTKVISEHFGEGIVNNIWDDGRPFPVVCTFLIGTSCAYDILGHGNTLDDHIVFLTEEPKETQPAASDPINPSHYRVEGIPEAIDIMHGLMSTEQIEGFLWGNIIKYAYRYGLKGDKKETAGKIKWYADMLEYLNTDNGVKTC